jgi:hypothetical protein
MNLPEYKGLRTRTTGNGRHEVLDILRHKYVNLTPEEWVRQHFINYLITDKGYPQGLLANEVELKVGDKKLRCDSVLYGHDRQPRMIIEYKAENVPLTPKVVKQITTYNMILKVKYLIISNGLIHLCLHYEEDTDKWTFLEGVPEFKTLNIEH